MKTGRAYYNLEAAARILADATIFASDAWAAEKHGVSRRTVERYRQRVTEGDAALAALVEKKVSLAERSWHRVRNRGLTALAERVIALSATEPDIDKVTRAMTALGELDIASVVLNAGASDHQQGSGAQEDPRGSPTEDGATRDDSGSA